MRTLPCLKSLALFGWLAPTVITALPPIVVKGSKFFEQTTGNQFIIRGITYSPDHGVLPTGTQDILAEPDSCKRDIPFLKQLNLNLVTVEGTTSDRNHSACMRSFADAGIYVQPIFDAQRSLWTTEMFGDMTNVLDELSQFDNLFGIQLRTSMTYSKNDTSQGPYALAMARDTKMFLSQRGYRSIPVGASFPMSNQWLNKTSQFLQCTAASEESLDYVSINDGSFCNNDTYANSSFPVEHKAFQSYPIPVFFQEYAKCDDKDKRLNFRSTQALYGDNMTDVFSGGILFQFFDSQAYDNGLVTVSGGGLGTNSQFGMFSTTMAAISPKSTSAAIFQPTATRNTKCPTTDTFFQATATALPPTPFGDACDCMMNSLECVYAKPVDKALVCTIPRQCDILAGIQGPANGTYGAWTMCNMTQQASWLLNKQFIDSGRKASICAFGGSGSVVSPTSRPTASSCSVILRQAQTDGQGTLTAKPSFTKRADISRQTTAPGLQSNKGDSGLSTGAKAGIGVGVALGVLAIIAAVLAALYIMRKRRQRGIPHHRIGDENHGRPELEETEVGVYEKSGLDDHQNEYYMPGSRLQTEFGEGTHPGELIGSEPHEYGYKPAPTAVNSFPIELSTMPPSRGPSRAQR